MSWHEAKLGDYFEITSSKRVFESDWKKTGIPFYRTREIVKLVKDGYVDNELFISEEMYDEYSKKYGIPTAGDILVTGVGTLGVVYLVKEGDKFYFKDGNVIWLKKKKDIDSKFVEYVFKTEGVQNYIQNAPGATVGTYTIGKAKETPFHLPPLAEQQKIAAILDAANSLRQKDQQLVERYTALSQSLFLEMFGDPVVNSMGWNKITVEEAMNRGLILDIQDGNHGERHPKVSDFKDNGLPFIMANCLRDGEVDLSKSYKLHSDWLKILRVGFARAGDVLLSHKGTVGAVAVIPESVESLILSPQVTYYRTSMELDANFLATQFACESYQQLLDKEAKQSTRAYIGITRQKQLSIIVPPIALQVKFFEYLQNIKRQKKQAQLSLEKSEALFNSLLQRAFTGELTAKMAA